MKNLKIIFLALAIIAAPMGALAVTYITSIPATTGLNGDVDTLGEVLTSDGPTQCEQVVVCNALSTGDVIYVGYSSSALTYGAGTTLATEGYPLYPLGSSGQTCTPPGLLSAHKIYNGIMTYINTRHIWVYAAGVDSKASWICSKFKN